MQNSAIIATEIFLVDSLRSEVILGLKKPRPGKPFAHAIIGVGGKCEPGESVIDCAHRETFEEFRVRITAMRSIGTMETFRSRELLGHFLVHLFIATAWNGEPQETDEVAPVRIPLAGPYPPSIPHEVHLILGAIAHDELIDLVVRDEENGTTSVTRIR